MKKIILASNSPRRKEILTTGKVNFEIKTSECEEIYSLHYDEQIVRKNSLLKASAVITDDMEESLIIGADTIVILDSVCLVKPQNVIEALFMLKKLSSKTHMVVTSHTIINSKTKQEQTEISKSYVTFKKLSYFEIIKYLINKKPFDKAGSYGIQDFITIDNYKNPPKNSFISKIDGSYYNVVGFDLDLVLNMLQNF